MRMVKGRLNPTLDIFGVLMTMHDVRTTLSRQVVDEVREYFGDKVFESVIPRNVKLSEAPSHGLPVCLYAPTSKGAIAYDALAQEVVDRG
jgi:chromosome partitioning protein